MIRDVLHWPDRIFWYRFATFLFTLALFTSLFDRPHGPLDVATSVLSWVAYVILVSNLTHELVRIELRKRQVRKDMNRSLRK